MEKHSKKHSTGKLVLVCESSVPIESENSEEIAPKLSAHTHTESDIFTANIVSPTIDATEEVLHLTKYNLDGDILVGDASNKSSKATSLEVEVASLEVEPREGDSKFPKERETSVSKEIVQFCSPYDPEPGFLHPLSERETAESEIPETHMIYEDITASHSPTVLYPNSSANEISPPELQDLPIDHDGDTSSSSTDTLTASSPASPSLEMASTSKESPDLATRGKDMTSSPRRPTNFGCSVKRAIHFFSTRNPDSILERVPLDWSHYAPLRRILSPPECSDYGGSPDSLDEKLGEALRSPERKNPVESENSSSVDSPLDKSEVMEKSPSEPFSRSDPMDESPVELRRFYENECFMASYVNSPLDTSKSMRKSASEPLPGIGEKDQSPIVELLNRCHVKEEAMPVSVDYPLVDASQSIEQSPTDPVPRSGIMDESQGDTLGQCEEKEHEATSSGDFSLHTSDLIEKTPLETSPRLTPTDESSSTIWTEL